jgi:probable F420-dependent oxidoreductase
MSDIGGILGFTDNMERADLVAYVQRIEALGYRSLWLPDLFGRELFSTAGFLLAQTTRLHIGTGIANIYCRDATSAYQGARTLSELYDGRFLLGLGVSNPHGAELRGHRWTPPIRRMREYLEGIAAAVVNSPEPVSAAPVYIAAHGPKMLAVAAKLADGANTYLMPPAHTREAREILGPDKALHVVLPCCLCEDADQSRRTARKGLAAYLAYPAYRRQWERFGFRPDDFEDGGSDRFVDGVVAWGDEAAIRCRVAEHITAGASAIVVISYNPEQRGAVPHWKLLETLAPGSL